MTKTLLILVAAGALISIACFSLLGAMGGFHHFRGPAPWRSVASLDGPTTSRNLPFAGGERLDMSYPAEITMTQGPQPRFTVTGPKGLVDQLSLDGAHLKTPDEGGFPFAFNRPHGKLSIDIVSPNTHEFHFSGAEKLSIRNFDQDSLVVHSSGASDVDAQGKAKRLEVHVSGAGEMDLGALAVDQAEVHISGAGDATIDPHVSAEVSISGAGHVKLKTRPANLQTHISGFGSVD
jgi:hypothetical protein